MPNRITKAIIPAAGLDTRLMPASLTMPKAMFPIVQADGRVRPVLHILIREAVAAGIEQVALVTRESGAAVFQRYFADHRGDPRLGAVAPAKADLDELASLATRITYVEQPTAAGFGHAVWCARSFAGDEPVLVMLSDHLYLGTEGRLSPVAQMIECAAATDAASVVGVAETPIDQLHLYGTLGCDPLDSPDGSDRRLFAVRRIIEKPDAETARAHLVTAGCEGDCFLTHFGLYAFSPAIFGVLDGLVRERTGHAGEIQLTEAQQMLLAEDPGRTYALQIRGERLDMGNPPGLVRTQIRMGEASTQ